MPTYSFSPKVAQFSAVFALLIGILAVLGWYLDLPIFYPLRTTFWSMPLNTALCFITAGISMLLHSSGRSRLAVGLGAMVILVAGLTLVEMVFSVDLGIDRLLFPPAHPVYALIERMSPVTALNMLLLGGVLITTTERPSRFNAGLMLMIASLSAVGLLALLYNVSSLNTLPAYASMALPTALTFMVVAIGHFYSQPSPFLTILRSRTSAGLTGRRLIPLAIIVPVILGWLMTELSRIDVFDEAMGFALLVLLTTAVFVAAISFTMRAQYAEEKLRQAAANNALEFALHRERNRLLNEFVTNTLHDLRTPLSAIGTSAYIAGRTPEPDKRQERLEHIQAEVRYIGGLLDQFAEMVRLNQLEGVILTPTSLNTLVERSASEYQVSAERKGIQIMTDLQPNIPSVPLADLLLQTALIQVLNNAVRYTPRGGQIAVRTRCLDTDALIEVVDTGEGIPAAALQHVFEVQFKGNNARTADGSTGGMGLSMVKRILELHHGRAEIASVVGQGTTVRLFIPLRHSA